ncbi:MAG TPA: twin-arginine translocation signal domain-containing protein, partial [Acidobacteriota bacterium]|nr:twin-arginine translocation signal domain-containing protein [Acidobacteriota bacterium]
MKKELSRRDFLKMASTAGFGALVISSTKAWGLDAITNPLAVYPDRGWEAVYRDLWKYDSRYTFLCAPNDTHNCILNAHVRNGVV